MLQKVFLRLLLQEVESDGQKGYIKNHTIRPNENPQQQVSGEFTDMLTEDESNKITSLLNTLNLERDRIASILIDHSEILDKPELMDTKDKISRLCDKINADIMGGLDQFIIKNIEFTRADAKL